jgi:hypothetical protein
MVNWSFPVGGSSSTISVPNLDYVSKLIDEKIVIKKKF